MSPTVRGEAIYEHALLECVQCRQLYEVGEDGIEGGENCPECKCEGFIPRRADLPHKLPEKWPGSVDDRHRFVALPSALLEHRAALGLTPLHLVLLLALEDHRRRLDDVVFPSIERLVEMTGMSERSVRNQRDELVQLGLLRTYRKRRRGANGGVTHYDLAPLVDRLRSICGGHPNRQEVPVRTGISCRFELAGGAGEVEVVEGEVEKESPSEAGALASSRPGRAQPPLMTVLNGDGDPDGFTEDLDLDLAEGAS